MKIKFYLLLLTFSLPIFSQSTTDDELTKAFSQEELEEIESLRSGTYIKSRNPTTGLYTDNIYTVGDTSRTSLLYHFNHDLASSFDINGFEFIYAYNKESTWYEFSVMRSNVRFGDVAQNNTFLGADSDDLQNSNDNILNINLGLSYRGSWVQNLIKSDRIFTTTAASIGYYILNENFLGQSFSGPGLKTDFGLHRRTGPKMHWGAKMSYHLAPVKRSANFEGESSVNRSLLLSWLTFGVDLSFYW
jgi:hypothetical protein